jgi:hypothetical protein
MEKQKYRAFKNKAIVLRKKGNTYGDIRKILEQNVPKSTLSTWFRNIPLSKQQQRKIIRRTKLKSRNGLLIALKKNKEGRKKYLESIKNRVSHLSDKIKNSDVAKITLATLYLCEGSKNRRLITFGNSDPRIIELFLKLMHRCYKIDKTKLRCTLQCRADQNIKELEKFWSKTTHIPLQQFYGARIDSRTIGRPTKKLDYKGVCRIDYFSADLYNELTKIAEVITAGL